MKSFIAAVLGQSVGIILGFGLIILIVLALVGCATSQQSRMDAQIDERQKMEAAKTSKSYKTTPGESVQAPMYTPGYKPAVAEAQARKRAKAKRMCEYEAKKSVANQQWQNIADSIMTNLRMKEVYELCLQAHLE